MTFVLKDKFGNPLIMDGGNLDVGLDNGKTIKEFAQEVSEKIEM